MFLLTANRGINAYDIEGNNGAGKLTDKEQKGLVSNLTRRGCTGPAMDPATGVTKELEPPLASDRAGTEAVLSLLV